MKIKNETTKTAVVIVGMLVLFIGAVLVPYGYRDAGLTEQRDQAREELGIDGVDNDALVRLNDQVQSLQSRLEGRGQRVPNEAELSQVIRAFSGLINAPGVTGQEIVTLKPGYYADYNIMPVKIQFSAPFATAYDLIGRIETLSSVVRIDRLDIEAEPDYPRQPLTVNLELSAFFATAAQGGES